MDKYKYMDTIKIKTEQEFVDIYEWAKIQGLEKLNINHLPLECAKINIMDEMELMFISAEQTIFFTFKEGDIFGQWILRKTEEQPIINASLSNPKFLKNKPDFIVYGNMQFWRAIMLYMLKFKSDSEKVGNTRESIKLGTKRKHNRKRCVVFIHKSNYYLNSPVTKKKVNWQLESWGVRGHPRKLRSGVEIFIQPYTKGKGRKNPKEYRP